MEATEVFVYVASFGIIVLLLLAGIGFYLVYRTLLAAQEFFTKAGDMITSIQLAKSSTKLSIFKLLRNFVQRVRGGEVYG